MSVYEALFKVLDSWKRFSQSISSYIDYEMRDESLVVNNQAAHLYRFWAHPWFLNCLHILSLSTQLCLSCDRHFMTHLGQKMTDDNAPLLREQESTNV